MLVVYFLIPECKFISNKFKVYTNTWNIWSVVIEYGLCDLRILLLINCVGLIHPKWKNNLKWSLQYKLEFYLVRVLGKMNQKENRAYRKVYKQGEYAMRFRMGIRVWLQLKGHKTKGKIKWESMLNVKEKHSSLY